MCAYFSAQFCHISRFCYHERMASSHWSLVIFTVQRTYDTGHKMFTVFSYVRSVWHDGHTSSDKYSFCSFSLSLSFPLKCPAAIAVATEPAWIHVQKTVIQWTRSASTAATMRAARRKAVVYVNQTSKHRRIESILVGGAQYTCAQPFKTQKKI